AAGPVFTMVNRLEDRPVLPHREHDILRVGMQAIKPLRGHESFLRIPRLAGISRLNDGPISARSIGRVGRNNNDRPQVYGGSTRAWHPRFTTVGGLKDRPAAAYGEAIIRVTKGDSVERFGRPRAFYGPIQPCVGGFGDTAVSAG